MFDSKMINKPTRDMIRRGFALMHGREMTTVEYKALNLTNARKYLHAAKQAPDTQITPVAPAAIEKASMSSGKKIVIAVVIVGVLSVLGNATGSNDVKRLEPAAKSEASQSQTDTTDAINTGDATVEIPPAPAPEPGPAPTPAPVAAPAPAPVPPPAPSANSNCDPNYTGGCVPNVSYDLDCPDIGFQVRVVGYDKHGFDGNDNDGLGCESY